MDSVQRAVCLLNERLSEYMLEYFDAVNSVHGLWLDEVAPPDEADIKTRITDPKKCLDDVLAYLQDMGALSLRFHKRVLYEITDAVMRVLDSFGGIMLDLDPPGLKKYGEKAKESWMDHIACLVHLRGEADHWYFLWYSWSD